MARTVEVFTAGCGVCNELVNLVRSIACSSCDVSVLDMKDPAIAERAKAMGIMAVPAIAVNGSPVERNARGGYDEVALRSAGVGSAV